MKSSLFEYCYEINHFDQAEKKERKEMNFKCLMTRKEERKRLFACLFICLFD